MKPYIKRLILLGTPSMGAIGLSDLYKEMGIALKYFENVGRFIKPFGTPLSVHNELKEIYDRYSPYYEMKGTDKYYSEGEDE